MRVRRLIRRRQAEGKAGLDGVPISGVAVRGEPHPGWVKDVIIADRKQLRDEGWDAGAYQPSRRRVQGMPSSAFCLDARPSRNQAISAARAGWVSPPSRYCGRLPNRTTNVETESHPLRPGKALATHPLEGPCNTTDRVRIPIEAIVSTGEH